MVFSSPRDSRKTHFYYESKLINVYIKLFGSERQFVNLLFRTHPLLVHKEYCDCFFLLHWPYKMDKMKERKTMFFITFHHKSGLFRNRAFFWFSFYMPCQLKLSTFKKSLAAILLITIFHISLNYGHKKSVSGWVQFSRLFVRYLPSTTITIIWGNDTIFFKEGKSFFS